MANLSKEIERHLPYLRRYARAMTGSRQRGDDLAERTLMSLVAETALLGSELEPRVAMFRLLQDLWQTDASTFADDLTPLEASAQMHLAKLTPGSRDALLLKAFERFTDEEIAAIMRTPSEHVAELIRVARLDIAKSVTGQVLVIEDELAIATEIEQIVTQMGHDVIGSAPSKKDALRIAATNEPDLILSDISLADKSSGIDAVAEILRTYPKKPVIYITGYPEQLLTGVGQEPAFLITKPYSVEQVRSAVSQAMFFAPKSQL